MMKHAVQVRAMSSQSLSHLDAARDTPVTQLTSAQSYRLYRRWCFVWGCSLRPHLFLAFITGLPLGVLSYCDWLGGRRFQSFQTTDWVKVKQGPSPHPSAVQIIMGRKASLGSPQMCSRLWLTLSVLHYITQQSWQCLKKNEDLFAQHSQAQCRFFLFFFFQQTANIFFWKQAVSAR